MTVAQAPNPLLDEFADLIASGATSAELLAFHPSSQTVARAAELLEKLKSDGLTAEEEYDLTMFHNPPQRFRALFRH